MSFTPTPEQLAIVEAAKNTPDNLLISALAGAAKTSTLVLIAEALAGQEITCLAFNRKIATEMKERLPAWCSSMTLSSLGYRAWGDFLRRRQTLDERKVYNLIKAWVRDNLEDREAQDEFWEEWTDVRDAVSEAKICGYVPSTFKSGVRFNSLMSDEEFDAHLDRNLSEVQIACVLWTLEESIRLGLKGLVDFDDMIYLPTLCTSAVFHWKPIVLVDETQDLNALQHEMLRKLTKGKSRVIAVGDECQSIYGFRGAHQESMRLMKEQFEMKELTLSISFRCPQSVVREAHWRAPHMQFPTWAVEGTVTSLREWTVADIPERAAIVCRNNAPLFSLALNLIRNGRYPELASGNLEKRITKILTKLGSPDMSIDQVLLALELWLEKERKKSKDSDSVEDLYQCLLIFTEGARDLDEVLANANKIFRSAGPIKLMTGHKSKGLEFPHVFILDRDLIRLRNRDGSPNDQERNLLYVMQTRAQETLTYVSSEGFADTIETPDVVDVDDINLGDD
jgi:superfamily I DNA/RNA helicase